MTYLLDANVLLSAQRYDDSKERSAFANGADGWLIAAAMQLGATIVTLEKPAPNSTTKPKIPTVANHFQVPCTEPWNAYEELNAKF